MTSARTGTVRATRPRLSTRGELVCQALLSFLLTLALLLLLVEAVGSCVPLYRQALSEAVRADQSALTEAHFESALRRTLDYTRGRVSELQMYLPRANPADAEPTFSEREIAHMADVRALFTAAKWVRAAAIGMILGALGVTIWGRRRSGVRGAGPAGRARRFWGRILLWSAGWGLVFAAAVAMFALVDFSWAFDQFHYLFFSNDLWLLPLDSLLITMLPMWQFARIAAIIGGTFALVETAAAIAGRRLLRAR